MKISALFLLPLATAALVVRQEGKNTTQTDCASLCLAAAVGDSVKQPRCGLAPQDIGCLCGDTGFVASYNNCTKEICPVSRGNQADDVSYIQESLVNECKKAGAPLSEPAVVTSMATSSSPAASATGTVNGTASVGSSSTLLLLPMPVTTASAYSSIVAAASSVLAGTTLPSASGAPAATTSAVAKSSGNKLSESMALVVGMAGVVILGYLV